MKKLYELQYAILDLHPTSLYWETYGITPDYELAKKWVDVAPSTRRMNEVSPIDWADVEEVKWKVSR